MRQHRWAEFLAAYDLDILYTPGKANKVADALSRQQVELATLMIEEFKLLSTLVEMEVENSETRSMDIEENGEHICKLSMITVKSDLMEQVGKAQDDDPFLREKKEELQSNLVENFTLDGKGYLRYKDKLCVPELEALRKEILEIHHRSKYTIHPGSTKMYHDLKRIYWWKGMKKSVGEYVAKCMVCQQVKAEYSKPSGLMQPL